MNYDEMGRCVAVIVLCLMLCARLLAEEDSKPWLTRETNGTFDITYSIKGRVENGTIAEYLAVEPLPKSSVYQANLLQSIESKRGHCGLRHRVFVTLLRAAGIPARTKNCNRPSGSPHVWAEFYLERYGWMPVNVARKAGDFRRFGMYDDHCIVWNNDSCLDIKSPTGRECRVAQTRGRWYWKSKSHKGKPIIEWEMRGTRTP